MKTGNKHVPWYNLGTLIAESWRATQKGVRLSTPDLKKVPALDPRLAEDNLRGAIGAILLPYQQDFLVQAFGLDGKGPRSIDQLRTLLSKHAKREFMSELNAIRVLLLNFVLTDGSRLEEERMRWMKTKVGGLSTDIASLPIPFLCLPTDIERRIMSYVVTVGGIAFSTKKQLASWGIGPYGRKSIRRACEERGILLNLSSEIKWEPVRVPRVFFAPELTPPSKVSNLQGGDAFTFSTSSSGW